MIEEPGEAIVPGDRLSFLVETGGHAVEAAGPVHVVLDILLARPYDLDGAVDMLRDLDGARRRRRLSSRRPNPPPIR
mgnify:CR=1 FL=1